MEVALIGGIEPTITKPSGTRSYILNLVEELASRDIKVILYGVSYNKGSKPRLNDLEFIPIARGKKISSQRFVFNLLFKALLKRLQEDVIIHSQRPDFLFPFALFNGKNPKICTLHGIPGISIKKRKGLMTGGFYNFLEKYSMKRINRAIFVDTKTREWFIRKYDWLKDISSVIPVGVNLNLFKPLERDVVREEFGFERKDKIIIYVGRLEIEKRVDLLIKSFIKIRDRDAKLVIVGDGPQKDKLVASARNANIKFMGTVPHEKIPRILNCANVLALCSEFEGMPTVVLEALACGIPVVSTNVGDTSNVVVNGKTGYLTEPNIKDINEKLSIIINNTNKYKDNCIEVAKKYSREIIFEMIINMYKEVKDEVSKKN